MNKIILLISVLFSVQVQAKIENDKLLGKWSTSCIQSQLNDTSGYLIEVYSFSDDWKYERIKNWFKDSECKNKLKKEVDEGTITIGNENTNNGFNPSGTYEVKYKHNNIEELGLLWLTLA